MPSEPCGHLATEAVTHLAVTGRAFAQELVPHDEDVRPRSSHDHHVVVSRRGGQAQVCGVERGSGLDEDLVGQRLGACRPDVLASMHLAVEPAVSVDPALLRAEDSRGPGRDGGARGDPHRVSRFEGVTVHLTGQNLRADPPGSSPRNRPAVHGRGIGRRQRGRAP